MADPTQKPPVVQPGPVLASLFSRAHALAKTDAILTALLCGCAIGLVVAEFSDNTIKGALFGMLIAVFVYLALSPESMVTGCLISAQKRFLDNQVTCTGREQMRKKCLRKSLLY